MLVTVVEAHPDTCAGEVGPKPLRDAKD
jgi:hypothetical protein